MKRALIAATLSTLLMGGCGRPTTAMDNIDTEERKALFVECMNLLPDHVSSKEGAVSECSSWAWSIALDRAHDRLKKGDHP